MAGDLSSTAVEKRLKTVKMRLIQAIIQDSDMEEVLTELQKINMNLQDKLQEISVSWISREPLKTRDDLVHLFEVIRYLRDIGLCVCPREADTVQIPPIPAGSDSVFKDTSSLVQGSRFSTDIMKKLGYTEEVNNHLQVPSDLETDAEMVAMVTADLVIASNELELYLNGNHPNPQYIMEILPLAVREQPIYENMALKDDSVPDSTQQVLISNEVYDSEIPIIKKDQKKTPPVVPDKPSIRIETFQSKTSVRGDNDESNSAGTGTSESPDKTIDKTNSSSQQNQASSIPECELCGKCSAASCCSVCDDNKYLCAQCDTSWHQHVRRRTHMREPLVTDVVRPPRPAPRSRVRNLQSAARDRTSMVVVHGKRTSGITEGSSDYGANTQSQQYYATPREPEDVPVYNFHMSDLMEDRQSDYYEDVDTTVRSTSTSSSTGGSSSFSPGGITTSSSSGSTSSSRSGSNKSTNDSTGSSRNNGERSAAHNLVHEFSIKSPFDVAKLQEELGREHDLHRRKIKVTERLTNVEQRLGSIASGLEKTTVLNRIGLLKEQEFLKIYDQDLDEKIQAENIEETPEPAKLSFGASIKDRLARLMSKRPLWQSKRKDSVESQELINNADDIYYTDVGLNNRSSDNSANGVTQINRSFSADAAADKVYEYVDVNNGNRSFSGVLPKPKYRVKKTESEPAPSKGSVGQGWASDWACEHCTLHNDKATRVCKMCHKTSVKPRFLNAKKLLSRTNRPPLPLPPDEPSPVFRNKSFQTMDELDNLALMQNKYAPSKLSHGERLNKLESSLKDNEQGVLGPNNNHIPLQSNDGEQQGRQLIAKLKEANEEKFTVEEFNIAYKQENCEDPLQWLKTVWLGKMAEVITKATSDLQSIHQGAQLSPEESRVALIQSLGHVPTAVSNSVIIWKDMYEELLTNLTQSVPTTQEKDLVVKAMNDSHGDLSEASQILFREVRAPRLHDGIWEDEQGYYGNDEMSKMLPGYLGQNKPYDLVTDANIDKERRQRVLMAEFNLDTMDKARNVTVIWDRRSSLSDSVTIADVIEAVRNCGTITPALTYLQQECAVCEGKFPASKIQLLSFCQCKLCTGCMREYFSITIKEKQVRDLVCPMCRKPDITNREQFEQHLQLLLLMLRHQLSPEDVELFEKKLRDWVLMQDQNFRWCSYDDCGCGFIFTRCDDELMMACPECGRPTCFSCRKPWEQGHAGQTCEQFALLKTSSDPKQQAGGGAALLQDGIDCPRCRCRYGIAKGGCMHFTCSQCGHEFCSGCYKTFYRGDTCTLLELCARSGLHCHHPRSCLYYLRNEPVSRLQKLLLDHRVIFLKTLPRRPAAKQTKCPVMELKDNNQDEPCGKIIAKDQAGLCELHYKEYLVSLINQHTIDPIHMMNLEELKTLFVRIGETAPVQNSGENHELYRNRLVSIIKQSDPLPSLNHQPSILSSHRS